jgi:hypothetical protein
MAQIANVCIFAVGLCAGIWAGTYVAEEVSSSAWATFFLLPEVVYPATIIIGLLLA